MWVGWSVERALEGESERGAADQGREEVNEGGTLAKRLNRVLNLAGGKQQRMAKITEMKVDGTKTQRSAW